MSNKVQDDAAGYSKILSILGTDITKMRFSYEVKYKSEREYWKKRMEEHVEYFKKSAEYYDQAYQLVKMISREHSCAFLEMIAKFQKLKVAQLDLLGKILQNPTIMARKDRQQSMWSKNTRESFTDNSGRCLEHEKNMNEFFRKFTETHLQDMSKN